MTPYSIPPLLTLLCFSGLAGLTILRGRRTKTNILFLIICILGALLYTDILIAFNVNSESIALAVSRVDHFFIIYLFPVYIHFFHTYLNITRRRWLVSASYVCAFILMWFTPTRFYIAAMQKHTFGFFARGGVLYPVFGLCSFLATVYILVLLYRSIRRETGSLRRSRLKYVFSGFGIMGLMNSLNIFSILGASIYPPGNFSFIPLVVFGIGLFRHDLLNMGILFKKSLIYSILTALLTCLYALIILFLDFAFKGFNFSDSVLAPILFFLVIAFILGPLKDFIQRLIDRIFYRGRYDYRKTLKEISKLIVTLRDVGDIGKKLTQTVAAALQVEHCTLFLNTASGSGYLPFDAQHKPENPPHHQYVRGTSALARKLQSSGRPLIRQYLMEQDEGDDVKAQLADMQRLQAEIILPIIFKNEPSGFIAVGRKRSGDRFIRDDIDLLETLSSQSALAIENACSYEKIEDLNKTLEQKVASRTRSLQDALLEKERTQEQLIRSESLAAIGQLVAGVAHELNNPLTSVKSLLQATIEDLQELNRTVPLEKEMLEDLYFADKELERAKQIVKSLLGLSRQTQTYTEAVDINAVVKDALRILYNQFKHLSLNISENYGRNLPEIRGNFANLGQVALNIIQNAIQAVAQTHGTVFLSTRFDRTAGRVFFECRDTGPGIAESIRKDIFKPFFTTKEVGQGTGLGLYLCHEIIKKHGGTLVHENTDPGGAGFIVGLPVLT